MGVLTFRVKLSKGGYMVFLVQVSKPQILGGSAEVGHFFKRSLPGEVCEGVLLQPGEAHEAVHLQLLEVYEAVQLQLSEEYKVAQLQVCEVHETVQLQQGQVCGAV